MLQAIVGRSAADKVLLYLQSYEQGYGREIAATFGSAQSQVQKQLLKLESGRVLVSRMAGRTRRRPATSWRWRMEQMDCFRDLLPRI